MIIKTRLSSSGTFFFKYIFPFFWFFMTIIILFYLVYAAVFDVWEFWFLLIFMFFPLGLGCIINLLFLKLYNIHYDKEETWVESFGKVRKFDNNKIKKVTQFLMYVYKLEFYDRNTKSVWFIAHLNDAVPALLRNRKPYSIKIYEETLKLS